jgi:hypothetical protein
MTLDSGLSDPYAGPDERPDHPMARPPRVEDSIPRHANPKDGRPKIWLPVDDPTRGVRQRYYSRPSSWGKKVEDTKNLSQWQQRMLLEAILDMGKQSRALVVERAALGPSETDAESKRQHNALIERALGMVEQASRVGTALHTITERWDLGLPVLPPEEFEPHLEQWKEYSSKFDLIETASGRPAVEVFVAFDYCRPGHDPKHWASWVRLAGTFDRIWRGSPCSVCGCRNRIVDLKTGKASSLVYNGGSYAIQEGIYANGEEYVPWPDGTGADRYPLPDICRHEALTISIPSDNALDSQYIPTNIAKGFDRAIGLVPDVKDHRATKDWFAPMIPPRSPWVEIDRAQTVEDMTVIWRRYPMETWNANDGALTTYAHAKVDLIKTGAF